MKILDVCSGSRMFWFDKKDDRAVFTDIRSEQHTLCDGRALNICPDFTQDFRKLDFADESFRVVVFDPPHLLNAGAKSWLALKYGSLNNDWREDLSKGFSECFRVLKPDGILIFKWNEDKIKVAEILKCTDQKPLFGHRSGKQSKTHWITFIKKGAGG